jgi:RNA polymerase sigma factor (sigma-70 family)
MTDWNEILRDLHQPAYLWALHCAGGVGSDAEDALQAAYEALLDGSAVFDGRSSPKSFLFAVIRNQVRAHRRKSLWRRFLGLHDAGPLLAEQEESGELSARHQAVRVARAALSPKQQDVVELVFYHDLTIEEAADAMGIGLGTARTHYARAKEKLRKELEAGDPRWIATTNA